MMIYWSDSNLAKKIKMKFGVPSPVAMEAKDWVEYHKKYDNYPIMKMFDILDDIQHIVNYPFKLWNNIITYIRNRFVHKLHYLDTKLPFGVYHGLETRLLHGAFNEFINYIEIEKGYNPPKHIFDKGNCPEKALIYLNWEINECENLPQSEHAKWELAAYNWWKFERPNRHDPYEVSGLNDYYEKNGFGFDFNPSFSELSEKCSNIEKEYFDEDTKWFIELIQKRQSLWT